MICSADRAADWSFCDRASMRPAWSAHRSSDSWIRAAVSSRYEVIAPARWSACADADRLRSFHLLQRGDPSGVVLDLAGQALQVTSVVRFVLIDALHELGDFALLLTAEGLHVMGRGCLCRQLPQLGLGLIVMGCQLPDRFFEPGFSRGHHLKGVADLVRVLPADLFDLIGRGQVGRQGVQPLKHRVATRVDSVRQRFQVALLRRQTDLETLAVFGLEAFQSIHVLGPGSLGAE